MDGFNNNNSGNGYTQPGYGQTGTGTQQTATNYGQTGTGTQQTAANYGQTGTGAQQTTSNYNQTGGYDQANTGYGQSNTYSTASGSYTAQNTWQASNDYVDDDYLKRQNKWFIISIVNTVISVLCCCSMFGSGLIPAIVGLVLAITSKNSYTAGDPAKAESSLNGSKIANIVVFVFIGLCILGHIIYYLLYGAVLGASFLEEYNNLLE